MKHQNIDDLPRKHRSGAEGYEFIRRDLFIKGERSCEIRSQDISNTDIHIGN